MANIGPGPFCLYSLFPTQGAVPYSKKTLLCMNQLNMQIASEMWEKQMN